MRIKIDEVNDALYIRLDESKIVESVKYSPALSLITMTRGRR